MTAISVISTILLSVSIAVSLSMLTRANREIKLRRSVVTLMSKSHFLHAGGTVVLEAVARFHKPWKYIKFFDFKTKDSDVARLSMFMEHPRRAVRHGLVNVGFMASADRQGNAFDPSTWNWRWRLWSLISRRYRWRPVDIGSAINGVDMISDQMNARYLREANRLLRRQGLRLIAPEPLNLRADLSSWQGENGGIVSRMDFGENLRPFVQWVLSNPRKGESDKDVFRRISNAHMMSMIPGGQRILDDFLRFPENDRRLFSDNMDNGTMRSGYRLNRGSFGSDFLSLILLAILVRDGRMTTTDAGLLMDMGYMNRLTSSAINRHASSLMTSLSGTVEFSDIDDPNIIDVMGYVPFDYIMNLPSFPVGYSMEGFNQRINQRFGLHEENNGLLRWIAVEAYMDGHSCEDIERVKNIASDREFRESLEQIKRARESGALPSWMDSWMGE